MEKKKTTKIIVIILAAIALVVGILFATGVLGGKGHTQNLDDAALEGEFVLDYTKQAEDHKEAFASGSKGYSWENGEPFNTWWNPKNVSYDDAHLALYISEMSEKEQVWDSEAGAFKDCVSNYYGGEERTSHYYGYGDFEVRMKVAAIPGTASTFFTCTGPYDVWYDEAGNVIRTNDHDEIDIEFLGKDTTKVQFNYFASGKGGHEYMYNLGFDASKEFHNYGFRWTEESITWFVDGKPVYKVLRSEIAKGEEWPEEPGRMVMNYWCGTTQAALWMGEFKNDYSGCAQYEWIKTSAKAQMDPASSKEGFVGNYDDIVNEVAWDAPVVPSFTNQDPYTVTIDEANKTALISYEAVKANSYANAPGAFSADGRNYVRLTLTSKTDKDVMARVNLLGGGKNLAKRAYVSNGETAIDGGALVTIPANGSVDVIVYYEGTLDHIELMLDSLYNPGDVTFANQVEVSKMCFGVKGQVIEGPTDGNNGVKLGNGIIKFKGDYDIVSSEDQLSMSVTYSDVVGNSYKNMTADFGELVGDNKTLTFNVTNNGDKVAKVRVDITCPTGTGTAFTQGGTTKGKNNFCNIAAAYANVSSFGNDYDWTGGDWFKVAPGKTATIKVSFTNTDTVTPLGIMFYVDSSTYDDPSKHSGELVFSNFALDTAVVKASKPSNGGKKPTVTEDWTNVSLSSFDGWGMYNVTKSTSSARISHSSKVKTYACAGEDINFGAADQVKVTVKNNSTTDKAYAKISVKNNSGDKSAITSATIDGVAVDYVEYGALCELAPGQSVELIMNIDPAKKADKLVVSLNSEGEGSMPAKGDVTISNLQVKKSATEEPEQPEEPTEDPIPSFDATGWNAISVNSFDGWGTYTVDKTDGLNISHTAEPSDWACCGMDIALGSDNKVRLTIKNNGSEDANVKITIKNDGSNVCAITKATANGSNISGLEYGAATTVGAKKVVVLEMDIDPSVNADKFVVSLNSDAGNKKTTGNIKIVDLYSKEQKEEPTEDPIPSFDATGWNAISVSPFDGWGAYTVDKTDGLNISHTAEPSDWACCGMDIALGSDNKVRLTIKNNGSEDANVKITIKNNGSNVCAITKATANGSNISGLEYGAATTVGAKKVVVLEMDIDPSVNADKFVVSLNSDAGNKKITGNIKIVDLYSKEQKEEPTEDPIPSFDATGWNAISVSPFDGWGAYTVDKTDGLNISHTAEPSDWACCGMDIALGSDNKVRLTIKNNGSEDANVKITIKNDGSNVCAITKATANGSNISGLEYGAATTVGAKKVVVLEMDIDPSVNADKFVVSLNSDAGNKKTTGNIKIVDLYSKEKVTAPVWDNMSFAAFDGWGNYTIDKSSGLTIVQNAAYNNYQCCGMDYTFGDYTKARITVTNNDSDVAYFKITIKKDATNTCAISAANVGSYSITDLANGAAYQIPANSTVTFELTLDASVAADKFVISLNSEGWTTCPATGNITISSCQLSK